MNLWCGFGNIVASAVAIFLVVGMAYLFVKGAKGTIKRWRLVPTSNEVFANHFSDLPSNDAIRARVWIDGPPI
jgi:hypothetical protein